MIFIYNKLRLNSIGSVVFGKLNVKSWIRFKYLMKLVIWFSFNSFIFLLNNYQKSFLNFNFTFELMSEILLNFECINDDFNCESHSLI